MAEERVSPKHTDLNNLCKHYTRYVFATQFCRNKRVLDAACGVGYGSRMLRFEADHLVGWDIDTDSIELAQHEYSHTGMDFYVNNLNNTRPLNHVGVPDGVLFDTIVSFETLEHLEDPHKTLSLFWSLLKPGGILVYSVPLHETKGWNPHHKHTFTIEQWQALDRPAGSLVDYYLQENTWIGLCPNTLTLPDNPRVYGITVVQTPLR